MQTTLLDECQQTWGRRVLPIAGSGICRQPPFWESVSSGSCTSSCAGIKSPISAMLRATSTRLDASVVEDDLGANAAVWDARRRHWVQAGVVAIAVTHPDYEQPLWLVVSRPGKGRPPWYLLTTEAITGEDDAWKVVFAYARRGPLEMTWRESSSELACESPRLVARGKPV